MSGVRQYRKRALFCSPEIRSVEWSREQVFPLIESDKRISRIRLSEKVSRFRPRKAACPSSKFDKVYFPSHARILPRLKSTR